MHLSYRKIWSEQWRDRRFRMELFVTLFLTTAALAALANFVNWVEARPGVLLDDPVLRLFRPVNVNWLIFSLIYISLACGIVFLSRRPRALLIAFQSYLLMVAVRIAAMYVVPLVAPPTPFPLQDPAVVFLGTGKQMSQDLFFSGHTSTLFLLFLTARGRTLKTVFLVCTIAVGMAVLVQHVHYAVDVLVAPFVAYTCFRIATLLAGRRWSAESPYVPPGVQAAAPTRVRAESSLP